MRRGFDGLARQVQQALGHDPFSGQIFVSRGRRDFCGDQNGPMHLVSLGDTEIEVVSFEWTGAEGRFSALIMCRSSVW